MESSYTVESATIASATYPSQKPMLRQIEWKVQNGPITMNAVLPISTLFFWKFCFSIRTCYK